MRETPEQEATRRMNLIGDAITYKRESGAAGEKATIQGLDAYRMRKKAVPSAKPVEIIGDEGDGDDGDDEEETKPVIKQTRKKLR